MFKKRRLKESYDAKNQRPIIRVSICTGEQVAGFKDKNTGKFTEIMLIQNSKDMDEFLERYDISADEISKEY